MEEIIPLKKKLEDVQKRLHRAAVKRGASLNDITLVAVTKNVSAEVIREAWELGVRDFGENRVQEALPKIETLPPGIRWHFVGRLQTNKVKHVVLNFNLLQSLDRIRLAQVLQKEGEKLNTVVNALLQINIGGEESKAGFSLEEVEDALEEIRHYQNIRVLGLMTIAPYLPDPEEVRPYFRQMYRIFQSVKVPGVEMKYLSMGMSGDFEVAVEEGANMVRLGTALFGEREPD